ncbi:MAG: cupredoxin domain-containing protein [Nitrospiria bacterium]
MKGSYRPLFSGILFMLMLLAISSLSAYSADPLTQASGLIEINIRNSTYEFQGGILKMDRPAVIVIHNLDSITHGFSSPLFEELEIQVESNGVTSIGKGIKTVHIGSGKTVRIHFLPNRPGKFSFRCDLHPNMKGELLILSIESI